jgi:hypothetical protein
MIAIPGVACNPESFAVGSAEEEAPEESRVCL